jgi:pimeloyl-ACP methyl ester carboxylesterase
VIDGRPAGAPLGTYTGINPSGEPPYGVFGGTFSPFDEEDLRERYPDHREYVDRVTHAADRLLAEGHIVRADRDAYVTAAVLHHGIAAHSGGKATERRMNEHRIHRVVSSDGTEIAGRVHGQGPPLVLVHGGLGDDTGWSELLPYLTEHFVCYSMTTRGRGLSAAPADTDYSLERLVQDVAAFAASVGEPVGLVGHSLGGALVLGAAAESDAVSAVAVYEPAVFEATSEVDPSSSHEKATRSVEAWAEGRLADAARVMIEGAATYDELAALSARGAFEAWASKVGVAVQEMQQAREFEKSSPTHPSLLTRITVPILYLHGERTPTTWYREGVRHVANHVADLHVVEIPGVGHFAPLLAPERIASELIRMFTTALQPTSAGGMTRGDLR